MNGQLATELMERFAGLTGLTGKVQPRRYLWTDAFAVCNFLGLLRETGHSDYLQLAMRLVDQVHRILGRHRPDDQRSGWISGLSEEEGERHPTSGGLRIGKTMNERQASEPPDPQLEWDRDGQYFHYLTKWMHALNRVSGETGDDRCLQWAAELAIAAHRAFVQEVRPGGPKRMAWKMSIDLSRPLVDSMGQHDPLDGLVTSLELRVQDRLSPDQSAGLDAAIADFSRLCNLTGAARLRTRWALAGCWTTHFALAPWFPEGAAISSTCSSNFFTMCCQVSMSFPNRRSSSCRRIAGWRFANLGFLLGSTVCRQLSRLRRATPNWRRPRNDCCHTDPSAGKLSSSGRAPSTRRVAHGWNTVKSTW